jgi:selenocysteine lyase/cysteine desulfurase
MSSPQTTVAALLPGQCHLYDIPDDVAFLNCAYMSPLPKASFAAGERGLARKARPWMITPEDFVSASEAARARFAGLINAAPDDVAFAPAVSYGMAQAAANIALVRTQTIVTLAEQFPSNVYPWMELAERTGAQFIAVPRPGDDEWTAALLAAINTATGVVAVQMAAWALQFRLSVCRAAPAS